MGKDENNLPADRLTVQDLSCLTGLSERTIQRLIALDVIEPSERTPEPCFPTEVITHVRRIRHLHVELGVSWSSMPLVLDLLERIDTLVAEGAPASHPVHLETASRVRGEPCFGVDPKEEP